MLKTISRNRSAALPWALLALILLGLWLSLFALHRRSEAEMLKQAEADTRNLARAVAEHALATFQRVDLVLHDLRRTWLYEPQNFVLDVERHQNLMKELAFQVAAIDADGKLEFSNLSRLREGVDLSDREHFRLVKERALRGEDALFVSRPVKGRVSGKWSIQLARPILDGGKFSGVLVISIAPEFFARFFGTVDLGATGAVVLVRDTGEILSRAPDLETSIGKVLTGTPYLEPGAPEAGNFRRQAQIDGKDRFYGFRRLPQHGVSIVVGLPVDDLLAPLHRQYRMEILGALGVSVLLFVLVYAISRSDARLRRSRDAVARSEATLRNVYELLPIGVLVAARDGRIVDCNRSAESILGMEREALLSHAVDSAEWNAVGADGKPLAKADFPSARALAGNCPVLEVEMGIGFENRDRRWLRVSAMPTGRVADVSVLVVFSDITERRQQQRQLAASERRFRALFDSFTEVVCVIDTSGRFSMVHLPDHPSLAGVDGESWRGQDIERIFPAATAAAIGAALARTLAEEEPQTIGFRHAFAGVERDYQANISLMCGDAGRPEGFVFVARDVTAERAAAESQRIAAKTFESQEGMMVTDERGIIVRVNRAFTELTGYSAEEVVGRSPALLKSGRQNAEFYRDMWMDLEYKGYWQGEVWNRRKSGEIYPEWLTISAVTDDQGTTTHYVGAFSDISERKEAEDRIRHLAFYDPLTSLPNRRLLLDRLQQAMAASQRSRRYGALMYLDLDHFKLLNDTRGHDAGDELLFIVAERLRAAVREEDTVARFGGDEFVVMLEGIAADEAAAVHHASNVAEKIRLVLGESFALAGGDYGVTPSIGLSLFLGHAVDVQTVLKQADMALYQAKEGGRNTVRFFSHAMQEAVRLRADMLEGLRHGIEHSEFILHLQPQFDIEGRCLGAEALVRWRHPERGLVLPGEFIPLAEESGLIVPLGRWVLETACDILASWRTTHPDECMAVNVSACQFQQPDFVDVVAAALARSGADPARLCLELTESAVLADVGDAASRMESLKAMGVMISLDDFGTGYSALSCLKQLPIDEVKIDRSFISDVASDTQDAAIVRAIIAMCRSLGVTVIAEGVETEAQRDFLSMYGCDAYQGFLLGYPLPEGEFQLLAARRR